MSIIDLNFFRDTLSIRADFDQDVLKSIEFKNKENQIIHQDVSNHLTGMNSQDIHSFQWLNELTNPIDQKIPLALNYLILHLDGMDLVKDIDYICRCFGVSLTEFEKSLEMLNVEPLGEIVSSTKASLGCGRCKEDVKKKLLSLNMKDLVKFKSNNTPICYKNFWPFNIQQKLFQKIYEEEIKDIEIIGVHKNVIFYKSSTFLEQKIINIFLEMFPFELEFRLVY